MKKGILGLDVFQRRKPACKAVAVVSALAMLALTPVSALAAPVAITGSADVLANVNGGAVISGVTGSMTLDTDLTAANINLTSGGAGLINWSALNVGNGQSLGFTGGDFYNVVGGGNASQIAGQLNASGALWIFNPAGVSFMNGAQVSVGGLFGVAAAGLENESAIKSAITGGTPIPDPLFMASGASVSVGAGAKFEVGGDMALVGKSVSIESGADISKVGALKIAAGKNVSVEEIGGGKVTLSIADFADVDDDINVTFGGGDAADINVGDADHAGDVDVVTEGSILVNEAVVAKGDVSFRTLAKPKSEVVVGHKKMSVASGKYLQGKSVSATAAGKIEVGGNIEAEDGAVALSAGEYINVANAATISGKGIAIEAAGNVNMDGSVAAADGLKITSKGIIKADGAVSVTSSEAKSEFSAEGGKIELSNKNNAIAGTVDVVGGEVDIQGDSNNFAYGKVAADTSGNLTIKGNAKDVTIKGAVAITGDFTVDGAADISLESGISANDVTFKGTKTTVAGNITGNDLAVKNADGTANADLKQTAGAINVKSVTAANIEQSNGSMTATDGIAVDGTIKQTQAAGMASSMSAKTITATKIEQSGGTISATEKITADVEQSGCEIDTPVLEGNLVQKAATDIATVGEITGNVTQSAGLIQAKNTEHDYVDLTIDGSLTQNGGKISDVGTLTIGKATSGAAVVSQAATGAIEADAVAVTVVDGTDVTLAGSANKLGSVGIVGATGAAGAVTVVDSDSTLVLDTLKADTLTVTAAGKVTQLGAADVAGLADVTAKDSGGTRKDISLLAPANKFGSVKATGALVEIKEADDVVIAGADATGMLLVEAGPSGDPVEYTGAITQTGAIKTGSGARFYGKSVTLTHGENAMGQKISARADNGDIEIVNGGTIKVDSLNVTASGSVKLTAKSGNVMLDSGAEMSAASLELTAENGDISLAGKATVTSAAGKATLSASKGSVTAQNAANDFKSVTATAKNVALNDKDDVTLTAVTATAGDVSVTAGGKITVSGAVSATMDADGTGKVTLTTTAGDIDVNAAVTADATAKIDAKGKLRVKGDVTGADVDLDAGDFINVAAGKTVKAKSGAVDVAAAGNADVFGSIVADGGAVSVKATGAGKSVRVGGLVDGKTGVTLEGDKSVQVGGAVSSSDGDVALTAKEFVAIDGGSVTAEKGTATLKTTPAELLTAGGSAATYQEGQLAGVMVGGASAGTVAAKNVVVESAGSVLVNTGSSVTGADGVTITANGTTEATVATSGITKQGVYVLGGVTATDGTLEITAKGEGGIQASGVLVADKGATTLTAANGAVDAQNAANDFKSVTATAKNVALNDKDDVTLTDVQAKAGNVDVTAGGQITATKVYAKGDNKSVTLVATDGGIEVGDVQAAKQAKLDAATAITTAEGGKVQAGDLDAKATTGIALKTAVATATVKDTGTGNVTIAEDDAITLTDVQAKAGDVSVTAGGQIAATKVHAKGENKSVTLVATDGGIEVGDVQAAKQAKLSAAKGAITTAEGGKVQASDLDAAAKSGITLKTAVATATVKDTGTGNVTIAEDDAITLTDVQATAGDVRVKAGSITVASAEAVKVSGQNIRLETTDGAITVGAGVSGVNVTLEAADGITENAAVSATADKYIHAKAGDINVNENATVGGSVAYVADGATARVKTGEGKAIASPGAGGQFFKKDSSGSTASNGGASSKDGVTTFTDATEVAISTSDSVVINNDGVAVTVGSYAGDATITEVLADPAGGTGGNGTDTVQLGGEPVDGITAKDVTINVTGNPGATAVSVEKPITAKNGDVTIIAENGDVVIDGAMVKAGTFTVDAATGEVDDTLPGYTVGNIVFAAGNGVVIENGAQVGASGTVDVDAKAGGVTVAGEGTKLAANGAMTLDADGGDVEVLDKAFVGGNSTVSVGADGKTANATVDGAQLVAKGDLAAKTSGNIDVKSGAKVASDKTLKLEATGDGSSVTVEDGAKVLAADDIDIDAKGAVTVDNATVAAKGDVLVGDATTRAGSLTAQNSATVTADGSVSAYVSGNATVAKGTGDRTEVSGKTGVTVDAGGDVTVDGAVVKAGKFDTPAGLARPVIADGDNANLVITAGNGVKVQNEAMVGSSGTATVTAKGDDGITINASKVASHKDMTLSATKDDAGSVTVRNGYVGTDGTLAVNAKKDVKIDPSVVESAEDIEIDAGGDVVIEASRVSSSKAIKIGAAAEVGGDVKIQADASDVSSTVMAKTGLEVNAAGGIKVGKSVAESGLVYAGVDSEDVHVSDATAGMTLNAGKGVSLEDGARVGAADKMGVDAKTDGVTVTGGSILASNGAMTIDADGGAVKVEGNSKVASASTIDVGTTAGKTTASLTVNGSEFVAKGSLTAKTSGNIDVKSGAKAASDANVSLTATADGAAVSVEGGSNVLAKGNVTITAGNGVSVDDTSSVRAKSGTLSITANGADGIQAAGRLVADNGATTLTAANSAIDAQNAENDFQSVTATAKDSLTLNDRDDITLTEVKSTAGDVRVKAVTDKLTVADADAVKVSGANVRLEATDGAILVGAGVSGKNVTLNAGTTVETKAKATGAADGALTADKGDLYIVAGDNVKLGGAQTATADTDLSAADKGGVMAIVSGGKIEATGKTKAGTLYTKDADGVSFADVSAEKMSAVSGKDIKFTFDTDVEVAYKSTGGKVEIESSGNVTVKSATAPDADLKVTEVKWPSGTEEVTLVDHTDADTQVNGITAATTASVKSTGDRKDVIVETQVVGGEGVTLTSDKGNVTIGTDTASGAVVKAGKFAIPTDGTAPVIEAGDSASLTITAGKSVTVQKGAKVGASGTATIAANGVDNATDKNGVVVTGEGTQLASEGDMKLSATEGKMTVGEQAYVGTHGTLAATASDDMAIKDSGTKVESSKAMTLSGANVTVQDAAKVGSGKNVSITADNNVVVRDSASVVAAEKGDAGQAVKVEATAGKVEIDGVVMAKADDISIKAKSGIAVAEKASENPVGSDATQGLVAANGGKATLETESGDIIVKDGAQVAATGDVDLTATKSGVTVQDAATVLAGTLKENGSVDKSGSVTIAAGQDAGAAAGAVAIVGSAEVRGTDAATVTAKDSVKVSGSASVTAANGAATITAQGNDNGAAEKIAVEVAGTATVEAGTSVAVNSTGVGDISITTAGKGEGGANKGIAANGGNVTIGNASGNIEVNGATVTANGGNATLTAGKDDSTDNGRIDISGTVAATATDDQNDPKGGNVTLTAKGADVSAVDPDPAKSAVEITGTVTADQKATINATTGSVDVKGGTVVANGKDADNVGIDIDAGMDATISGTVVAKGGDANIDAAGKVEVADGKVLAVADENAGTSGRVVMTAGASVKLTGAAEVKADQAVTITADGNDGAETPVAIHVTETSTIEAGTAVAMNSTAAGGITIDTTESVTAKDGDVKIDNKNGKVTIKNAAVEAKGDNGSVDIDATTGVTIEKNATVKSDKNDVLVETTGGNVTVKDATVEAGDNMRVAAGDGDVTIDTGVTLTADQNLTVEAGNDVNIKKTKAPVEAKKGDAYVLAKEGNVNMDSGTKVSAGNNAYVGAPKGNVNLSTVRAGNTAWLETSGSILNNGGAGADNIIATQLRLEAGGSVGESAKPLNVNVEKIEAVAKTGSAYINEKNSIAVGGVGDDNGNLVVKKVTANGETKDVTAENMDGVSATKGDVSIAVGGDMTVDEKIESGDSTSIDVNGAVAVNSAVSGKATTIEGGSVAINGQNGSIEGGEVRVTAKTGDITQEGASVGSAGGYAENKTIRAGITADNLTLTAERGSIGKVASSGSDYVGVAGGAKVAATASGDVAIAAADGSDLDVSGITAGNNASVYTTGTIKGGGTIKAGDELVVSAKNYTGEIVPVNVGKKLTVNNFKNSEYGRPLLSIFKTSGGNKKPKIKNQPNDTIVFLDGRLAGGDLKTINKLGALEAFPVQTPELKSEQGVFGNPIFLHDELDVANPFAIGAIDFLLQDVPRLTLSSDFPLEVERQVAAVGLNPTTSYRFGQESKSDDSDDDEVEGRQSSEAETSGQKTGAEENTSRN